MPKKLFFILFQLLFISCILYSRTEVVDTLTAKNVTSAPEIDGVVDDLWSDVSGITITLGETYDLNDPASIMDCAGCHSFNSSISVNLKSVYTDDFIYFLATWPDPNASFTRGGAWSFSNGFWEKLNSDQSEDRISFFWPIGPIEGYPYNTGGCMAKCHNYWPTDTDPHVSDHGIVDDAWLADGRGDMWHSKAGRGAGYLSTSGTDLTVDPVTHQVTGGSFSMIGFMDDKYVDVWAHDSINGEDGGRYGDEGTSGYSHNRIGDKSRPKFMEKAPSDFADAMFLTQDEIDEGECVGDATTGVSDADATTYWSIYASLNAIVPERILRQPEGSRGDLDFGAVWNNGTWTAEMGRELQNGYEDDVQFNTDNDYVFGVAEFDNSRHGYQHRTSEMRLLEFGSPFGIGDHFGNQVHLYNLNQNFPNPFTTTTTISFRIPTDELVTVSVYDIRGRLVTTLLNESLPAGNQSVEWYPTDVKPGIYFYSVHAGTYTAMKKCILLED